MTFEKATLQLAEKPALVVVDMQNGFLHKDGFMSKIGFDVTLSAATIKPIQRLIEVCRNAGLPVVWTRQTLKADYSDAGLLPIRSPKIVEARGMLEGSWDNAIIDELSVEEKDILIDKKRYSAFFKTDLLEKLQNLGVYQVILTGVTTNVCVEGTGRDAYANDIQVVIVEDCTGAPSEELHRGALNSMKYGMGPVVPSFDVIQSVETGARKLEQQAS